MKIIMKDNDSICWWSCLHTSLQKTDKIVEDNEHVIMNNGMLNENNLIF